MIKITRGIVALLMLSTLVMGMLGCKKEGPAERAGKEMDRAAEKVGDQVENAGDKMKDVVNDLKK